MRILVAAGGTGGHIYPALAVVEELRHRGSLSDVGWIGSPSSLEATVVSRLARAEFLPLPTQGLDRRRPWTWPRPVVQTLRNVCRAAAIVRRFKPDVVFGTGGHVAFAPLVAARLLGVPTAIHEQNVRMGLANRLLARWVDLVLLSSADTRGVPSGARATVTGNPVRADVTAISPNLGDELLVVGGSRGSRSLVDAVLAAAPDLSQTPRLRMRLLVGGAAAPESVAERLAEAGVIADVACYADPFSAVLRRARLVVARAGATTAAEVAAAGRPAVFVPWDRSAGRHQHANARAMARGGAAVVVEEKEAPHALGAVLNRLWLDDQKLHDMALAARATARPDAARQAAAALIALVEGRTA